MTLPDPTTCLFCTRPRDTSRDHKRRTPMYFPACNDVSCKKNALKELHKKWKWDARGGKVAYRYNIDMIFKCSEEKWKKWSDHFISLSEFRASGCVRWTGQYSSLGVPYFIFDYVNMPARRMQWILHHGELAKDIYVHAKCRRGWCVGINCLMIAGSRRVEKSLAAYKSPRVLKKEAIAVELSKLPQWYYDSTLNCYRYSPNLDGIRREIFLEDYMYRVFFNGVRRKPFDTVDDAKHWAVNNGVDEVIHAVTAQDTH